MAINRVTPGVTFNTGISNAEFVEAPAGQATGQTQGKVLPGSTTVSEAINSVFPKDATISGQIMTALAAAGNSTLLRTPSGFHSVATKTIKKLRKRGTKAADKAADEIEELLADTELLDQYRAALLES